MEKFEHAKINRTHALERPKMTMFKNAVAALLAATALTAFAGAAQAQEFKGKSKGDILVRARIAGVVPVESGDIKTATGVDTGLDGRLNNDIIPEVDFTYFLTDNIAFELIAGTSRHKVSAVGAGANINVGKISVLPPTLTAQYHFMPKEKFSPYVGAGLNYTIFYAADDASGFNGLKVNPSLGFALQAGADFFVTDKVFLNLDVKKIWLDSTLKTNLGATALTSKVDINPWVIGVGVGYKF
jgi:outer membrane protein